MLRILLLELIIIDVAANQSIVQAARSGIKWAKEVYGASPGLMISISDGKDIHFRKAKFDPLKCPSNCSRPCEKICPTSAINYSGAVSYTHLTLPTKRIV